MKVTDFFIGIGLIVAFISQIVWAYTLNDFLFKAIILLMLWIIYLEIITKEGNYDKEGKN